MKDTESEMMEVITKPKNSARMEIDERIRGLTDAVAKKKATADTYRRDADAAVAEWEAVKQRLDDYIELARVWDERDA